MSYTRLLYHIVFRTKRSAYVINIEHERKLYMYLFGIMKNLGATTYRIGGMPDHIHILVDIPPSIAVSDFVREIKRSSSLWLKQQDSFPNFNGWSDGYAAFSYSIEAKQSIIRYIMNQKQHHLVTSFEDEIKQFLIENGIEIDDVYFLKD